MNRLGRRLRYAAVAGIALVIAATTAGSGVATPPIDA
jgi:hypothetical protein